MFEMDNLKFDKNGLIPVVVQDATSKKVLTLAYMNKESLTITLKEKRTCFYSRSRQTLWRKGETSGNVQYVVNITADCDFDALLIEVTKTGAACHTGEDSCFFNTVEKFEERNESFSLNGLYAMLEGRKNDKKEGSYTSYLYEKGLDKILKKVGEECTEVIIAAKDNDKAETVFEIADLTYHVMVLMVEAGIDIEDIKSELAKRHVVDKKVKQEKMQ